ncbi:MAG: hypothetical protein HWN69_02815 [Desulfobacterales bacterium]|nr:hypothetical protein [Desulfobacterales bacterium]
MASPSEQIIVVNAQGERVDLDKLMDAYGDSDRVLANDEVGKVLYVGDLDLYALSPLPIGGFIAQKMTELSTSRFSTHLIRRQIGAVVLSVTADTVFLVREDEIIKKVRAEDLRKGMALATGEKVFS